MSTTPHVVYGPGGFDTTKPNDNVILSETITVDQSAVNLDLLQQKAQNAIANNVTFLGLSSPTNAQAVAQVQALTRQVDALIRVVLGLFDSTAGT